MLRHILRIFRSDLASWVPTITVVVLVTVLIGTCMNQFVWTSSAEFVTAAKSAGLDPAEFATVSVTIYVLIAFLTFFALTVVGSATVERTRGTFAQWRLVGASPRQVRRSLWLLVGLASISGALPGSLLSIGASSAVVPVFNQMAAESFPNGLGNFAPPAFQPSAVAWAGSLILGVSTCFLGALVPSWHAARIEPVEAVRDTVAARRHGVWARWLVGGAITAIAVVMAGAGAAAPRAVAVGTEAATMVNAALMAGLVAAIGTYVLGSQLSTILLALARGCLRRGRAVIGTIAARSAWANAGTHASRIAPLAAAIGLAGVMLTTLQSYQAMMSAAGFAVGAPNYADTFVMIGLLAFVALLTSVAVIALSGGEAVQDQALLRAAGMSPRQVTILCGWQSLLFSLCAVILGLVPITFASVVLATRSTLLVGHLVVDVPWAGLGAAMLFCWAVLFLVQWSQVAPWLRRETAAGLRAPA